MRRLSSALLVVLPLAFLWPCAALAQPHSTSVQKGGSRSHGPPSPWPQLPPKKHRPAPSPVAMQISAGYHSEYRPADWVPVRISVHNKSNGTVSGLLEIPVSYTNQGPPQPFHALYQAPVVLPAGVTKQITMYVPGVTLQGQVEVQFRDAGRTLADAWAYVTDFGSALSVGALANDPANAAWLRRVAPGSASVDVVRLSTATLDPMPQALANLDLIVLADGATSNLTPDQIHALDAYVQQGGSLILVGGPGWQETLRPVPSDLVPGRLTGAQTVPDLLGLRSVDSALPPKDPRPATVSLLTQPSGAVLASERGIPLVVQKPVGKGFCLYLAFDPGLDPILHWADASAILDRLVSRAAPAAMSRAVSPQGFQNQPPFFGPFGPFDVATELANIPAAALPSILLFLVLTVLYTVILGPINFLVLRRLKRRELSLITVPILALLCVGSTFAVALHLKGNTVLINTVGVVELDGGDGPHPATLYLGLFAPVRGDYQLTYDAPALPSMTPQAFYFGGPPSATTPLGLRLQEGGQTQVQFVSMNMWSTRSVALTSTVNVPGGVRAQLHVDPQGYIVGAVQNDTPLTLEHPAILAGNATLRLADMPPEATIPVRLKPHADVFNTGGPPIWFKVYGAPQPGGPIFWKRSLISMPAQVGPIVISHGGPGQCCWGPGPPSEKTTLDRIRNVVTRLPEAQTVDRLGQVLFVAWNRQSLGSITVDGVAPQRRDLNMILSPLSVSLPSSGTFQLRTGTVGARLVDVVPQPMQSNGCCGGPTVQPIFLGSGGSATFEFDLPLSGASRQHTHVTRLGLSVNAGGADGTDIGQVFDWVAHRWVHVDLSTGYTQLAHPDSCVSPVGTVLLRLTATDSSGDIQIGDMHQDLQISGAGSA